MIRYVEEMTRSKMFVGIIVLMLNIGMKNINLKLSPAMESYVRYTLSRNVLIFGMVFLPCRDIYVSLGITILFIILIDYLLNEESIFSILPESFTKHHLKKVENMETKNRPTAQQIKEAIETLQRLGTEKNV